MNGILKKIMIAAALLVLTAGLAACGQPASETGSASASEASSAASLDTARFVILHTNDIHGHVEAADNCLGIAAVGQLKKDFEEQGYDVLLLDAGDMLQGNTFANYTEGKDLVKLMNMVGYDAMALGNHEFDYGADVLEQRMSEMDFPALAANITVKSTGKPFAETNAVFTLSDGTKVGVFGLDTPTTVTASRPSNTAGLSFTGGEELFSVVQAQIDELKEKGCSVIVCLGHLGEGAIDRGNSAEDIVANTKGLTVMIDGHDHRVENQIVKDLDGNDVPIAETGCFLKNIGVLTFENGMFTESLTEVGAYTGSDPELAKAVEEISAKIEEALGEKVAVADFDLHGEAAPGTRDRETNLGDLATDAIYWQVSQASTSKPDAAILNGGAFRSPIKAGDIRLLDIRNVFPFNNQLCTIKVTGATLLEALEAATQGSPAPMGAFPQVSGIKYTLDTTVEYQKGDLYPGTTYYAPAKPGSRVTITEVGGKPFDLEAEYTIATIDFIATGGDTYYCLTQPAAETMEYIGYLDYEGIVNYLKTELGGTIPETYAKPQGRITVVGE